MPHPDPHQKRIIDSFHDLYYNGLPGDRPIFAQTTWMGVPCEKCPLDLWIYQEILHEVKPALIIETGTRYGGSALFLAQMLDLLGHGEIVTIDIDTAIARPQHARITYVAGSSGDANVVSAAVAGRLSGPTLVILDSDHSKAHVKKELDLLANSVSVGSYLIVEDTNINGHPTARGWGDGPWEAVTDFLATHKNFVVDESREKFLMTFNPRGYLKRTA